MKTLASFFVPLLIIITCRLANCFSFDSTKGKITKIIHNYSLMNSITGYITSFSYRLPADSYAIFRLGKRKEPASADIQRRNSDVFVNKENPRKARTSIIISNQIEKCQDQRKWSQLAGAFPECQNSMRFCGSNADSTSFGNCLVTHYPQTRDLTMMNHSNHDQIVNFDDDKACTEFVKSFFANCQQLIPSCIELQVLVSL